MKTARVFMGNNDYFWVYLDKDLEILKEEEIKVDEAKLQINFDKEVSFNPKILGIVDTKVIRLKFMDDGKYLGIIWAGNLKIGGTYVKT